MIRGRALVALWSLAAACDRYSPDTACEDDKAWSVATTSRSIGLAAGADGLLVSLDALEAIELADRSFGANSHALALLDPADGAIRWTAELPADGLRHGADISPGGVVVAGEVRVGGETDRLTVHRLDPVDGSEMWSIETTGERFGEGLLPIAASDDRVAVSTSTAVVMLDTADGSVLWRQDVVADEIAITADGQVAASQIYGSQVNLLDAADGSVIWTHDAGTGVNAIAATDDGAVTIAVGFMPYTIRRLGADGSVLWENVLSGRWFDSLVALPGGDVLWMAGLEDRVDTVDGTTVEDGCGYITQLAAAQGSASHIRPMCDCGIDSVATADPSGRAFLALPDLSDDADGAVSAFSE
jgi:outer membrane protein assembly factor BamB